jgi:hypothetical protein
MAEGAPEEGQSAPGYIQLTFPQAPESLFHTHEEYKRERATPLPLALLAAGR